MARIEQFEDIEAWKKGRALRKAIYDRTKAGAFAKDFALRDQIRRAAISITSNIAEGFERGGNREFIQFLAHANGSCGEVRDQLYVALDEAYLTESDFKALSAQAVEVSRIIAGFMNYLKNSALRSAKFRL